MKTGPYLLFALISIFLLGCSKDRSGVAKQDGVPNILFIMSDDHAPTAVSAYRTTW